MPARHVISAGAVTLAAAAVVAVLFARARSTPLEAGFWFEPISYSSSHLGGPLSDHDMQLIERIAREEVRQAFAALPISFTGNRETGRVVRVVQTLNVSSRAGRQTAVSGMSHAFAGFGGNGAVNFEMQAANAIVYADPSTSRTAVLEAIGRGIGRSAVHEFVHVFLGSADFHDGQDRATYEYASASRREQYYGDVKWGRAWPLLQRRFNAPSSESSE